MRNKKNYVYIHFPKCFLKIFQENRKIERTTVGAVSVPMVVVLIRFRMDANCTDSKPVKKGKKRKQPALSVDPGDMEDRWSSESISPAPASDSVLKRRKPKTKHMRV